MGFSTPDKAPRVVPPNAVEALRELKEEDAEMGLLEWEHGTDRLTGLKTRLIFERELYKSLRFGEACVMFIDLDNFKNVNDKLGHLEGDNVLKRVADVVLHTVRETDTAARFGGDEFYVLLPQTNSKSAEIVANKILVNLKQDSELLELNITASIGISSSHGLAEPTLESLVKAADDATNLAKTKGRDRVELSKESIP